MFLGRDYANHNDYSAETSKRIDDEVERIMRKAHARATKVLSSRRKQMETMAAVLLDRETVEGEVVDALLDDKWDEYVAEHPSEAIGAADHSAAVRHGDVRKPLTDVAGEDDEASPASAEASAEAPTTGETSGE